MNWEAISAVGEIAGAAAVVLSLAYVAVQIRQNTQVMRRSSSTEAVTAFRELLGRLIDDPDTNRIFRRGLEDLNTLDEDDRARCWTLFYVFFKTFEDLHYQYLLGLMDKEVWEGYEFFATGYLTSPGPQQYWHGRKAAFTPAFQEWLASLTPPAGFDRMGRVTESAEPGRTA